MTVHSDIGKDNGSSMNSGKNIDMDSDMDMDLLRLRMPFVRSLPHKPPKFEEDLDAGDATTQNCMALCKQSCWEATKHFPQMHAGPMS